MRPIPIITALITVAILFLLVFQREALRDFVGLGNASEAVVSEGEPAPAERDPGTVARVEVTAMVSRAQDIDTGVIVRGETEAKRAVTLVSETSGRVAVQPSAKGSEVAQGDVVCELDPGTREVSISQAEAQVAEAEKNLAAAEALSEDGFASETRVLSARAAYQSATAALEQAKSALDDTEIRAPFAGVIDGDVPEVGTLLQPGGTCARIVQLNPMKLIGYVPELDVARIEPGAQVGARLATGEQMIGTLTYVGRSADPVTRTFLVEAEVANDDLSIRSGQTVEMLIASAGRAAHLVPQSALTLNDAGDLGVRSVGDDDVTAFLPVEIVRDSTDGVWVAGLPDEVAVIVVGQDYVKDGVPLDVQYRESGS
ncbi:efflux RND transporter periplasmic adaptor subunit [Maritimibacter dapengensis]|uniref:Efflux RND transporter periplasmic adaptor subunit n=1 Tax=Maritimibacter dapengensis TaxID=2836868 RepID=A0ABS6T1W0_9RHOB|nr:efflux RND transporter periplasmic adaptor subunit [Maritimibacter dapengensis]MBV7379225.1 efflux RND transporter periplasmic adaptor subunit [Maritimibacter dapengensis]